MTSQKNLSDAFRRVFRVVDSGILAISTVAIIQFLQLGTPLPFPLNASVYGFAISMTLAGIQAVLITLEQDEYLKRHTNPLRIGAHIAVSAFAIFFFYAATMYVLAFFSFWVGIVFVVTSSLAYALVIWIVAPVSQKHRLTSLLGSAVLVFSVTLLFLSVRVPGSGLYEIIHWLP